MHLTCLAIAFSILAVAPAPSTSPGKTSGKTMDKTDDLRSKFEAYLATHDVPTAVDLKSLAPAPEKPLMTITSDSKVAGLTRSRAVAALRLLPSPAVQAFLGQLVENKAKSTDPSDRLIVRRAAVALGWMAGPDTPELLALLFQNEDPEVRLDAVIGLVLTRAISAPAILRKQLAVESAARVRNQIERQLHVLGQPPTEPVKPQPPTKQQPMRSNF